MAQQSVSPEQWLELHSVKCTRYEARLSLPACRQRQSLLPEACLGCQSVGVVRVPELQAFTDKLAAGRVKGGKVASQKARQRREMMVEANIRRIALGELAIPEGACLRCGLSPGNFGRGLCAHCHKHQRQAGLLESWPMLKKASTGAAVAGSKQTRVYHARPAGLRG